MELGNPPWGRPRGKYRDPRPGMTWAKAAGECLENQIPIRHQAAFHQSSPEDSWSQEFPEAHLNQKNCKIWLRGAGSGTASQQISLNTKPIKHPRRRTRDFPGPWKSTYFPVSLFLSYFLGLLNPCRGHQNYPRAAWVWELAVIPSLPIFNYFPGKLYQCRAY